MDTAWTLRCRAPDNTFTLTSCGADTSFSQLQGAIAVEVGAEPSQLKLLAGFPPKVLSLQADEKITAGLSNQETIRVEVEGGSKPKAKPKGKSKGKAKAKAPAAKRKKAAAAPATGVHTLFSSSSPKAKKSKKAASSASSSGGTVMTLGGGQGGSSGSGSPSKRKRMKMVQLNSKDDAQAKLVSALSSGGARDTASQFLRAATKGAVLAQWEIAKANARYAAALSGKFEMEDCSSIRRLGDGAAVEMIVRFKKEQHYEEEQVQALGPEEVASVVRFVLQNEGESGREMMKPFKMAEVSPRIFWSIARLYKDQGGDIITAGLQALVPEHDWSCLERTTRRKSDRAMEAERTEAMVAAQEAEEKEEIEKEKAEKQVQKEKAAEKKKEAAKKKEEAAKKKKKQVKKKAQEKAKAKGRGRAQSKVVKKEVEDDGANEDEDESLEVKDVVGNVWAAVLRAAGVCTTLDLAGLDDQAVATHCTPQSAAIAAAALDTPAPTEAPTEEEAAQWLEKARSEAIDQAMEATVALKAEAKAEGKEIGEEGGSGGGSGSGRGRGRGSGSGSSSSGGGGGGSGSGSGSGGCSGGVGQPVDAKEMFLALEAICISTPRDLRLHPADIVVSELIADGMKAEDAPSVETVTLWKQRAVELLEQHKWMEAWVYQFEDQVDDLYTGLE